jgi:hypothetical protein
VGGLALASGVKYDHCTFKYSDAALEDGWPEVTNCVFDSNAVGIFGGQHLTNSKFTNHSQVAVKGVYNVINCEITDNNIGMEMYGLGVFNVMDNIIMNNDTGVLVSSCVTGSHGVVNNKICSNDLNVVANQQVNCDFSHNCWCSMDSALVQGSIYDGYINMSMGVMTFTPMDSICTPTTVPRIAVEHAVSVNVYPNPNHGMFTLQVAGSDLKNASVAVYDMMGRACYQSAITRSTSQITLDQSSGIYLVKLQLGEKTLTRLVHIE